MRHRGVKGTQDILPPESETWRYLEDTASRVFRDFGFQEIRLPVMEYTDVFIRSIGETTDIVEKEMYTFRDKGDRSVTLRPEGTASVVRSFVQNTLHAKNPVNKLFYMGPMFRYERPQAGRYRQFHQIGAEVFGAGEPEADAEILLMLKILLEKLGLEELDCQVNSIGCPKCRPVYRDAVRAFFSDKQEALCEECQRRFHSNPLRIMDCKSKKCIELRREAPSIIEYLDDGCRSHFESVIELLGMLEVPYTINPNLVRGLDYYTRTTFEVIAGGLGAQNAVVAGGRYDGLVEEFGGPPMPALGFAMGVERLISLIRDGFIPLRRPALFIAALGEPAGRRAMELAGRLRAKGVWVETAYGNGSLKSQMKRADKAGAAQVLIIGDEELEKGAAPLRDMKTREQKELRLDKVVEHFN